MTLKLPYLKLHFKEIRLGRSKPSQPRKINVVMDSEVASPKTDKKRWSKKRRTLAFGTVLIVLIGLSLLAVHLLSSPSVGTISQSGTQDVQPRAAPAAKNYSDKYISFSYPGGFNQVPVATSGSYLDVVNLNSSDHSNAYVAITVVRETLDNDSGLNHRRLHPETYKVVASSPTSETFTGTQSGYEKTGYIAHNGLVISISLTSAFGQNLSQDYDLIAGSLHWQ